MNLPTALRTIRWMIRDTFRQSLATKLFWVMLTITAICTLITLSIDISGDMPGSTHDFEVPAFLPPDEVKRIGEEKVREEGVRVVSGELSIGFGLLKVKLGRDRDDTVRFIQIVLAALLADTIGVLLALLWTSGFLPTFLEPQSATVLLAKPPPRWTILLGKYLGVVVFVALHAFLFVAGTWTALGLKTVVWNGTYWLALPLLVLNFGIFYAVSTFLAVWTRSTVATAFGTLLFWFLCWIMNYTHVQLTAHPLEGMTPLSQFLLDAGYWLLPKPLDLGGIFYDAIGAQGFSAKMPEMQIIQSAGKFYPELAVLSSVLFGLAALGIAMFEFREMDY
jgi:ABC-type transport system involved in multi-copper enzyme maturation permease subunit